MPAHILPKLIQDLVYQSENESDEFVKKSNQRRVVENI